MSAHPQASGNTATAQATARQLGGWWLRKGEVWGGWAVIYVFKTNKTVLTVHLEVVLTSNLIHHTSLLTELVQALLCGEL